MAGTTYRDDDEEQVLQQAILPGCPISHLDHSKDILGYLERRCPSVAESWTPKMAARCAAPEADIQKVRHSVAWMMWLHTLTP